MAILAAVLVPTVTSKIKDANDSAAKSDCSGMMSTVQSALTSYLSNPIAANKVSAQLDVEAEALPATMPTEKGTYVYGTETAGFVIFTVNGSIKYYGSVDKDGKTSGPSDTAITTLPNAA